MEEAERCYLLEYEDNDEEESTMRNRRARWRATATHSSNFNHICKNNIRQPANEHPTSPPSHGAPTLMILSP
jgi:hypothetical protein